jgi:hypothetical protein
MPRNQKRLKLYHNTSNTRKKWYHNPNPHNGPFPNSHVITHFKADTIISKEPTIPLELRIEPRTEICAIHVAHLSKKDVQNIRGTRGTPE